ncbi:hypothetical protein ACWCQS_07185 [Streptomyces sp. NPDC002076]
MREVSHESQQFKPDQHVVSRVLLDQFAEPIGSKGGCLIISLNRAYLHAKPTKRVPAGCGKFRHFVRYASGSSEAAWMATETNLREAFDAADNGTVFDQMQHSDTVRDAIVLHKVRSIPGLIVSDETWRHRHTAHIGQWPLQQGHMVGPTSASSGRHQHCGTMWLWKCHAPLTYGAKVHHGWVPVLVTVEPPGGG